MEKILQLFAEIVIGDRIHTALHDVPGDARSYEDIAVPVVAQPVDVIALPGVADRLDEAEMKMRLTRHVPDHTRDLAKIMVFQLQCLTKHIGAVEITPGGAFVDDDGMGIVERGLGIARYHRDREYPEQGGVGIRIMMVLYPVVPFFDQHIPDAADPYHLFDLWIVFFE